jgi:hypothetical protein
MAGFNTAEQLNVNGTPEAGSPDGRSAYNRMSAEELKAAISKMQYTGDPLEQLLNAKQKPGSDSGKPPKPEQPAGGVSEDAKKIINAVNKNTDASSRIYNKLKDMQEILQSMSNQQKTDAEAARAAAEKAEKDKEEGVLDHADQVKDKPASDSDAVKIDGGSGMPGLGAIGKTLAILEGLDILRRAFPQLTAGITDAVKVMAHLKSGLFGAADAVINFTAKAVKGGAELVAKVAETGATAVAKGATAVTDAVKTALGGGKAAASAVKDGFEEITNPNGTKTYRNKATGKFAKAEEALNPVIAGAEDAVKVGAEDAAKIGGKAVAKTAGRSILKSLPIIGTAMDLASSADRALQGDYTGAGIDLATAGASLLPFAGTAVAIGLQGTQAYRDLSGTSGYEVGEGIGNVIKGRPLGQHAPKEEDDSTLINRPRAMDGKAVTEKQRHAIEFFTLNGYTREQAAGIVGNLMQESSLDPTKVGDHGTSYGLAQWHNERKDALATFAKKEGKPIDDFDTQLAFVVKELKSGGSEQAAGFAIKSAKTVGEATLAASNHYERPNKDAANNDGRIRNAQSALNASSEGPQAVAMKNTPSQGAQILQSSQTTSNKASVVFLPSPAAPSGGGGVSRSSSNISGAGEQIPSSGIGLKNLLDLHA